MKGMCRQAKLRMSVLLLTLLVGIATDSYMRADTLSNCWGCKALRCHIVFIADDPVYALMHPRETFEGLTQGWAYF